MGPGPWKRRANFHKGLKIEHVSEATADQAEWGCLTLGGQADPGTQTDTCAWDSPRAAGQHCAHLPTPPRPRQRSATEHMTGLPQWGSGRKMKHFWVSKLSKCLGCSTWLESRERRGAGVARPSPRGTGSPQNVFMQHLGGRGAESFCPLARKGFFSSWEGRHRLAEEGPGPGSLAAWRPAQLQPAGPDAPGACGFVLCFW